ncbi:MAG: UDP-glucose/GDP-mannose dehydrogenase family protein [Nanoarchaeota archaeon]
MKISIIGCGYVGLVTGACFAEKGHEVICMDVDDEKISKLKNGKIPIYEPRLEEIVKENIAKGNLGFTTNINEAIQNSLINFIAVPTPTSDGVIDLNYVLQVACEIGKVMDEYKIIVNKSTVPVGTAKKVKNVVREQVYKRNLYVDFDVVSNPEFLKEGSAINDFVRPDRVVIGLDQEKNPEKAKQIMRELYNPFILKDPEDLLLFMTHEDAEMVKYASNAFLANKISFMNEIANICSVVGANIKEVKRGMILDPRIGKEYLFPGIGYGGSCLPKDLQGLISIAQEHGYNADLLIEVNKINEKQPSLFFQKIKDYYSNKDGLEGKLLTLWGLSFKPGTDDIREAPSLKLIKEFLNENVRLNVYDPRAMDNIKKLFGDGLNYFNSKEESLVGSYGLVLVTEWGDFQSPDFDKIKSLLKIPVIFDGRNIYDTIHGKSKLTKLGFDYIGIGV